MSFITEYEKMNGVDKKYYLQTAKRFAKRNNYNENLLKLSDNPKYKLNYDGVNFGSSTNLDYIIYKKLEQRNLVDDNTAEERRRLYLLRSKNIKGNWKNDIKSKNNLSRRIIWNA